MLNFTAAAKRILSSTFHRFMRRRLMAELAIADEGLETVKSKGLKLGTGITKGGRLIDVPWSGSW